MKTLKYLLVALFATVLTSGVFAQKSSKYHTVEMEVKGVCTMCQVRIESTTYDLKGVKSAKWDKESQILTVVVNPKKTSAEKVAKALAMAGHTSELSEADPKAYADLPDCCKYDDGVKPH